MTIVLNPQQTQLAVGISQAAAAFWTPYLNVALQMAWIEKPADACLFVAHVGHECMSFTRMVENLDYQPQALMANFSAFARRPDLAQKYGRTPDHAANQYMIGWIAYEGRGGNRPGTDDGWRYRGQGGIQVTFLNNHAACGTFLRLPLILQPELLQKPEHALNAAAWYWHANKLWGLDLDTTTLKINGPRRLGLDDRGKRLLRAQAVIK